MIKKYLGKKSRPKISLITDLISSEYKKAQKNVKSNTYEK